ncbi:hypothetical protein LF95_14265 [Thalassospira sp. TSL5-1]|nr:hypothetical protein LF95_14265 [Thalassospira sp. TSL5-1]
MSGEEALRRYDGHLRKYAGQDEKHDPGDGNAAANKPESTVVQEPLKEQGTERLGNRAVHPKDGQKGQEGQKGHEASSRADLAALAEWPLLTRIIGLIGTLGMLVALIVLGLFVAGWLSGL